MRGDHRVRLLLGLLVTLALTAGLGALIYTLTGGREIGVEIGGERYELLAPHFLAALAAVPFLAWALGRSLADLPRPQRLLALLLRALLVLTLTLALARAARTTDATRVSTIFLVDVSDSVPGEALIRARDAVQAAWDARGENDLALITFARDARVVTLSPDLERIPELRRHADPGGDEEPDGEEHAGEAPMGGPGAGSHLQGALQLAYGLFPAGHLKRVVILSDGVETEGDLLQEASRAAELGVRIHYHRHTEGVPSEIAVRGLSIPERIRVGEPFPVRARIFSTGPARARLRLYQGETLNGLDGVREVELSAGENEVELRSVVRVPGPVTYSLSVEPHGADRFAANNRYATTVVVEGRPTVLYVEGVEGRAGYLARALSAGDFEVDVRSPRAIPTSLRELERFDFFILSDVSADRVSLSQQEAIDRYVRELGGGFMMAGGESAFGMGGWQGTRIERLLPVRMDGVERTDQPSLAIALVIDTSGSMAGQKIELAKDAAQATAQMLGPGDYIEVVGFDSSPTRVVRMQSARNRIPIMRDIGRLTARGGTAIFPAVDMAFQDLAVTRARIKHVILLTDGQTQEQGIPELVQAMRAESITVSTVGLGGDVNRALLTQLGTLGGGRSYFTNDPNNVPRIFMRETSTVARNSVVEEYFRPILRQRADFLRGIEMAGAPFLQGYVATRAKPSPAQVILESDLGEPILARQRAGLGWALAWTSDVKNRWAVEWLRWPSYSRFFSQLVREHRRRRRRQTLDMRAEVSDGRAHVVVDAIGQDDQFLNNLRSTLRVQGPMLEGGRAARRGEPPSDAPIDEEHPLRQTAPGRYEASFPLERYGSFVLTARHLEGDRPIAESQAQLVNPYPREYATVEPDLELLRRASEVTGGQEAPSPRILFSPGEERIERYEELWPRLLLVALGLFLLDLLLRRVRIFDRNFEAEGP